MDMFQKMINMYDSEAHYLDLKFNMHKSAVLRVGKNFQTCCEKNGCPIDFVRQTKYLGASLLGGKYWNWVCMSLKEFELFEICKCFIV